MKLQRWKILLNEYDFNIEYIKGKENCVADGLSRFIEQIHDCNLVNINEIDSASKKEIMFGDTDANRNNLDKSLLTQNYQDDNNDFFSTNATIHSSFCFE